MATPISTPNVELETLRGEIQKEYTVVANTPETSFHFQTGRPLAELLGYSPDMIESVPAGNLESFAGTGNQFSLDRIEPGEHVVDVGSGAGFDSLIAARLVGPTGKVIGVDMTPAMLDKSAGWGL